MTEQITVEQLPGYLRQIDSKVSNPDAKKALSDFSDHFAGDLGEGFLGSKSQDGHKWPSLKNKRPHGHNPGTRPLIDTGALMLSLISDSAGHIEKISGDQLLFGTSVEYAAYHQFGTSKIPARPILEITEQQIDQATDLVGDAIMDQINRI